MPTANNRANLGFERQLPQAADARWTYLKTRVRQPIIGQLVDDTMAGIKRDEPALKGALPQDYSEVGR